MRSAQTCRHRRHIHNRSARAAVFFRHALRRLTSTHKRPHHIGVEHLLYARSSELFKWRLGFQNARVIHQACEPAQLLVYGRKQSHHLRLIRNIGL